jgi:hypothetical protein
VQVENLGPLKNVLKVFNLVQSNSHKDSRVTECITLLFKDIILTTFPIEMIDNHLKTIVQTRMVSYCKSGNLEDLWEDLIFMNHIISFKQILGKGAETEEARNMTNYEYAVHLPSAEIIKDLLEKCLEIHMRNLN